MHAYSSDFMFKRLLFIVLLSLPFSIFAQSNIETLKPSPDSSTIVFFRGNLLWRKIINFNIKVDDKNICKIRNNRYFIYKTQPHKAVLSNVSSSLSISNKQALEVDLKAGKIYYIQCCVDCGIFTEPMVMLQVEEQVALKRLENIKPLDLKK